MGEKRDGHRDTAQRYRGIEACKARERWRDKRMDNHEQGKQELLLNIELFDSLN